MFFKCTSIFFINFTGGTQLYKWKATQQSAAVDTLDQRYLFMPAMVKTAYLYKLLDLVGPYVVSCTPNRTRVHTDT